MAQFSLKITNVENGTTINKFLESLHLAKNKRNFLIQNNKCNVNGEVIKANSILRDHDVLAIDISDFESTNYHPNFSGIDILYEDDYLLIVNKPAKCIIYSDDVKNNSTLANRVAGYYQKNGLDNSVRHIHRLDFDTTGCILYAKDIITHAKINYMFENDLVRRDYVAVCEGVLSEKTGVINQNIGTDRHVNGKMIVAKNGKEAITNYEVIKKLGTNSLVKLTLSTGRTHQIRVHMAYIGHPLVGDTLYGAKNASERIKLHSYEIIFDHPFYNKKIDIIAPIPLDMKKSKS